MGLHAWLLLALIGQAPPAGPVNAHDARSSSIPGRITLRLLPLAASRFHEEAQPEPEAEVRHPAVHQAVTKAVIKAATPHTASPMAPEASPRAETDAGTPAPAANAAGNTQATEGGTGPQARSPLNLTLPRALVPAPDKRPPWQQGPRASDAKSDPWRRFAQSVNPEADHQPEARQADGNTIIRQHGGCFELGDSARGKLDPFSAQPKVAMGSTRCKQP